MTPIFFRSKSPILRVMANLPLTFGCPKLFQVIKPPVFFILEVGREKRLSNCVHRWKSSISGPLLISLPLFLVLPLRGVVDSQFKSLALPTQHGAAVPHAAHHQLDAVSQKRHRGGGSWVYLRHYKDIKDDMRGRSCGNRVPRLQAQGGSHTLTYTNYDMNTGAGGGRGN